MATSSNSKTPTPSDCETNFEFPVNLLAQTSVSSLKIDICQLTPRLSDKSYSAISADDVDRLRQIIKNMKHKRNDGIQLNTKIASVLLVYHTPNLSYNKYEFDSIYKYNSYIELKQMTTHSTNNNKLHEQRWIPKPIKINNTNNKLSLPWTYYKDITIKKLKNPLLNNKPDGTYFILGQFVHNLIDKNLQKSFLENVYKLETDKEIESDIRNINNNKYLHHKTSEFGKQNTLQKYMLYPTYNICTGQVTGGITPPRYYAPNDPYDSDSDDNGITPRIPNLYDLRSNESNISLINIPSPMNQSLYNLRSVSVHSIDYNTIDYNTIDSPSNSELKLQNNIKYKPYFNNNIGCMQYKCMDSNNGNVYTNTAFIHDIIDPNKNINDSHLWVPTVFDCKCKSVVGFNGVIKSQINGLDYVKYKNLYENIANIFKQMRLMFENVINRKLNKSEKIVIRLKKCVLQKYGDEYEEIMHKKGMGENIECIGMYFCDLYNRKNIRLQLSLNDKNNKIIGNNINISMNDCIVFSNECYHSIQRIVHNNKMKQNDPIYFCVLEFYLISGNEINIHCSNSKLLNINLIYNWVYIISYWLRKYDNNNNIMHNMSNSWMNGLIYLYLFGVDYDEYVYDRRQNIIFEKQKAKVKPNETFNITQHLHSLLHEINV